MVEILNSAHIQAVIIDRSWIRAVLDEELCTLYRLAYMERTVAVRVGEGGVGSLGEEKAGQISMAVAHGGGTAGHMSNITRGGKDRE